MRAGNNQSMREEVGRPEGGERGREERGRR